MKKYIPGISINDSELYHLKLEDKNSCRSNNGHWFL